MIALGNMQEDRYTGHLYVLSELHEVRYTVSLRSI